MTLTGYIVDMVNESLKTAARPAVIADMRQCAIGILESTMCFVATLNTSADTATAQALYGAALERIVQKYYLIGATGVVNVKAAFKLKDQVDDVRIHLTDAITSIGCNTAAYDLTDDEYTSAVVHALEISCKYLKKTFKSLDTMTKYHVALNELAAEATYGKVS